MDDATFKAFLETQPGAWRLRLLEYLAPRLIGDEGQKETALEMVMEGLSQAKDEGLRDGAYIIARIRDKCAAEGWSDRVFVLGRAHEALLELSALNMGARNDKEG